jgi:hypothetical protein
MTLPELAPLLSAGTALLLRLAGQRLDRPVARYGAGAAGLLLGWTLLQGGSVAPPALPVFALAATIAAAVEVTSAKPRPKRQPKRERLREEHLWLTLIALFGGWWLAGAGTPKLLPAAAGAGAILACGLLATDVWAVAAASLCLAAALLAVGAKLATACLAVVIAAACLGGGLLLPLAAGLGAAVALVLNHALLSGRNQLPTVATAAAPVLCLLLMVWWRHRFARFGRAAAPVRAGVAAGLVCLLTFSAAAMEGLR